MIQKFKELSDADIQNPFHYHLLVNINDVSQHLSLIKHKIELSSSWSTSRWGSLVYTTAMPSKGPWQWAQIFRHEKMVTVMAHCREGNGLCRWMGYPRVDPPHKATTQAPSNGATSQEGAISWHGPQCPCEGWWSHSPQFCNLPVHLQSPGDLTVRNM